MTASELVYVFGRDWVRILGAVSFGVGMFFTKKAKNEIISQIRAENTKYTCDRFLQFEEIFKERIKDIDGRYDDLHQHLEQTVNNYIEENKKVQEKHFKGVRDHSRLIEGWLEILKNKLLEDKK